MVIPLIQASMALFTFQSTSVSVVGPLQQGHPAFVVVLSSLNSRPKIRSIMALDEALFTILSVSRFVEIVA